jgi:hypothetical protein
MSIHLIMLANAKQIAHFTNERRWILQFLITPCQKYYPTLLNRPAKLWVINCFNTFLRYINCSV